jgi:hypothetical protein
LPDTTAPDSVSFLPALKGQPIVTAREAIVHHSINGMFAVRAGPWKLAFCAGSGGWGKPSDADATKKDLPAAQLYNLADDPAETRNLFPTHATEAARLTTLLERYIADGRSTPGPKLTNDVPVRWRRP